MKGRNCKENGVTEGGRRKKDVEELIHFMQFALIHLSVFHNSTSH